MNRNKILNRNTNIRQYFKGYGFLSFSRNLSGNNGRKLIDITTKIGIDAGKTASKKIVNKTGEMKGNKIVDKIAKPKHVQEMYKPSEQRQEILNDLRLV